MGVTSPGGADRHVLRVAFLTPEFPSEGRSSGGVGNYVVKMALALISQGVEAEVFVPWQGADVVEYRGIRVERVSCSRSLLLRAFARALRPLLGPRSSVPLFLADARRLARALDRRHAERPFDVVQSSNHMLTGAFVRRAAGRRRVVRVSTSRRLYDAPARVASLWASDWIERLDVRTMRRADSVYAPSRFLADYYRTRYGLDVDVLRPPAELAAEPSERAPEGLPGRYLVHFGTLGPRKGSEAVAQALPVAWATEPDLRMVWAGPIDRGLLGSYQSQWGDRAHQVIALGRLDKPALYRVVADAATAVLPSTVDNLPNTVIESLVLGVPVIGSAGASVDELVEDGVSGVLVAIGDVEGLAAAMVEAWRGLAAWCGPGFVAPAVLDEMRRHEAVRRFLAYAAGAGA